MAEGFEKDRGLKSTRSLSSKGGRKPVVLRQLSLSDSQLPAKSLEELVQCALCLNVLKDPRMLPCQHTFCSDCLRNPNARLGSPTVKTPLEKNPKLGTFELPNSQSENPRNEVNGSTPNDSNPKVKESTSNGSSFKLKDPTLKTPANQSGQIITCPICKLQFVSKGVETLPPNRYIISLLTLMSSQSSPKIQEKKCASCLSVSQLQEDPCEHCAQSFCKVCFMEHAGDLTEKLPNLRRQLEESSGLLEHRLENFEGRCRQLKENVKTATEMRILEIKVKEEQILEQVDKLMEREKTALFDLKRRIGAAWSEASEGRNKDKGRLEDKGKFEAQGQKESEAFRQNDALGKIKFFVGFHEATNRLLEEASRWGEARTVFDEENFKLERYVSSDNADSDLDFNSSPNSEKNPLENVKTLANFYKSHNFTPKLIWTKCPRPVGLGMPPWAKRHVYIAASESKLVLVLDIDKNKVVGRLTHESMLCPQSIAFSASRKEIYVADKYKHCVHVFKASGEFCRSLCGRGSGEGRLISPEGVAVGPNEELIVSDTGNNRILILDPSDGRQVAMIGCTKKKTELSAPTSVACHKNRIVVADSGNNRVKVYLLNGDKILEFGSMGRGTGQFRSPEVVAVDPLGFILVGDSGNCRVQVFDSEGQPVRVLGGPGKFQWISGLIVSGQMEVITADHKSRSVHVF